MHRFLLRGQINDEKYAWSSALASLVMGLVLALLAAGGADGSSEGALLAVVVPAMSGTPGARVLLFRSFDMDTSIVKAIKMSSCRHYGAGGATRRMPAIMVCRFRLYVACDLLSTIALQKEG